MRDLPTLNGLKCFLVAAEHLSFKAAAHQLHVSQSAVSQQIKKLEYDLGQTLFRRGHQQLMLTDSGQVLLPSVRQAYDVLLAGLHKITHEPHPDQLIVSVLPSFAARWLMPRIGLFLQRQPALNVRIAPALALTDFEHEDVDVAIRFGHGQYAGLRCVFLMNDCIYPVGHPQWFERYPDKETLLAQAPLLEDFDTPDHYHWQTYYQQKGQRHNLRSVLQVNDTSLLIEALLNGDGIGLVRHSLVYRLIARGQLKRIGTTQHQCQESYYLVAPERHFRWQKVQIFQRWLIGQLREEGLSG